MDNRVQAPPGEPQQPPHEGNLTTTGIPGVVNRPHDDYTDITWVPAWMLPAGSQLLLSIFGAFGGVFLGAGLQTSPQIADVSDKVIVEVAKLCSANPGDCQGLKIISDQGHVVNLYFWVGLALLVIYAFGTIFYHVKSRKKLGSNHP